MRVTVLGSGSRGNAVLVDGGGVRLLVDAGFSGRELARRLDAVDVHPESIDALLVTHDHRDHVRGMGIAARRWGWPIFATDATVGACRALLDGTEQIRRYRAQRPLRIGGLRIDPFLTVHDAVDPIAITVEEEASGNRLGIATDLGRPTTAVRHALRDCHLLILEANHDEGMLRRSPYPWSVQARIAGSHGHLSNGAAGRLAAELCHEALGGVILAHLSERANQPELAQETVARALDGAGYEGTLKVARQSEPITPVELTRLRNCLMPAQLALL